MSRELTPEQNTLDCYRSYYEAIKELRKRHVIEGKDKPRNAQEEQWLKRGQ